MANFHELVKIWKKNLQDDASSCKIFSDSCSILKNSQLDSAAALVKIVLPLHSPNRLLIIASQILPESHKILQNRHLKLTVIVYGKQGTLSSDSAHLHFSLNCLPNEEEIKKLTYQNIVQQTTKRIKQSTLEDP